MQYVKTVTVILFVDISFLFKKNSIVFSDSKLYVFDKFFYIWLDIYRDAWNLM